MKGYTIQNSIDLLEKGGNGSGGSTTASNVSYDNTISGLSSDNVQGAIDELKSDIPTLNDYGIKYSATEHQVGYGLNNEPIYQKTVDFGALPNATSKKKAHGIENLSVVYDVEAVAYQTGTSSSVFLPLPQGVSQSTAAGTISLSIDLTDINITAGTNISIYDNCYVTITYSKVVTETKKTRRK